MEGDGPWHTRSHGSTVGGVPGMTAANAWSRASVLPPCVPHGLPAVPFVRCNLGWDPLRAAELELSWCRQIISGLHEELARVRSAHALEVGQLRLEVEALRSEMHRDQASPPPSVKPRAALDKSSFRAKEDAPQGEVVPRAVRGRMDVPGAWASQAPRPILSPAVHSLGEGDLHELAIEPSPAAGHRDSGLHVPGDQLQGWDRDPRSFMDQSGAGSDLHAAGPSREDSLNGNKVEAKIARVVVLLQDHLPTCSETEIRRHVEEVRRLQQGFSRMPFHSIVALVLGHARSVSRHGDP